MDVRLLAHSFIRVKIPHVLLWARMAFRWTVGQVEIPMVSILCQGLHLRLPPATDEALQGHQHPDVGVL